MVSDVWLNLQQIALDGKYIVHNIYGNVYNVYMSSVLFPELCG